MDQSYPAVPEVVGGFGICFILAFLFIIIVSIAINIFIYCKLSSKAGYHWAMGLWLFVPVVNLVMACIYIFGQWPIQRELESLKQSQMAPPPPGQPHESFWGN